MLKWFHSAKEFFQKYNPETFRFYFKHRLEKWMRPFQAINSKQFTLLSFAFGLLAAFLYFFSAYFPTLYLFATLFLFFKWVSFEWCQVCAEKEPHINSSSVLALNRLLFEITDILLWMIIILADTHYYVIGIFLFALYWGVHFTRKPGFLDSISRTLFLLPLSLLQMIIQKIGWKWDLFYCFFVLIILSGIFLLVRDVYGVYREAFSHSEHV